MLTERKDEKYFDKALEKAFNENEEFAEWFLSRTKFRGTTAKVCWSRSDHPWARLTFSSIDPITQEEKTITRDSETDVLVVYESDSGERLGVNIENKLSNGSFEPYQPETYKVRAKHWIKNPKYGDYEDFDTVLVAPRTFFDRNLDAAKLFGSFVSYEEIAVYVPDFSSAAKQVNNVRTCDNGTQQSNKKSNTNREIISSKYLILDAKRPRWTGVQMFFEQEIIVTSPVTLTKLEPSLIY